MKTDLTSAKSRAWPRLFRPTRIASLLLVLLLLPSIQSSYAGSATWLATPASGDWNTAANWTAGGPPNGSADTATFATSIITNISISAPTEVNAIVFNAGANAFTITASALPGGGFDTISGVGITNNSGVTQNFATSVDAAGDTSPIHFSNSTTAGSLTAFLNPGAVVAGGGGGSTEFHDTSNAGTGTFTNNGSVLSGAFGGATGFFDTASASNATLIANGSPGESGRIYFFDDSTGGTARVEVFGNGTGDSANGNLDLSSHNPPGVTVGSIEGSGSVLLGVNNLTTGSNNLSTVFSGKIMDGGIGGGTGGTLTKTGKGKLTLSSRNGNTYTGGTTVSKGTLLATNRTGSATGRGAVLVKGGTLSGTGKMTGALTIASGGSPGILAPGIGPKPGTLTTLSTLIFNSHATYAVDLNSSTPAADQIVAKGVTIISGAVLTIDDLGITPLTAGTVFTLINNTAAGPISGTFSNLADGSSITVGNNTYLVSYEGGTGNELTLTVQ